MLGAMGAVYVDIAALGLTAVLFGAYFAVFAERLRHRPERVLQGLNRLARGRWSEWVLADAGRAIVAVQTFRNGIMAGTFFASVAMLLILGSLNLIGREPIASATLHRLNFMGSHGSTMQTVKSLLLVADFAVAFFSFALSVRLLVHAGYHVLPASSDVEGSARRLGALLDRSALYYAYGMRAYWVAVPLVFWLFSPVLMLGAAVLVVALLANLDRVGGRPPARVQAP